MNESSKTRNVRPPTFAASYLAGRLIDIGAGDDLVCPWAEGFDVGDGDANVIARFRAVEAYDAVHSSHCLEHMNSPQAALLEWWSLVKPGGFLVVVVPEESLYEQRHWPSLFNGDHKWTFRIGGPGSWSPRSIDVSELFQALPGGEVLSVELQDMNYDRNLQDDGTRKAPPVTVSRILILLARLGPMGLALQKPLFRLLYSMGYAVDQTLGSALAQIQVVAKKHRVDARKQA